MHDPSYRFATAFYILLLSPDQKFMTPPIDGRSTITKSSKTGENRVGVLTDDAETRLGTLSNEF